MRKRSHCCADSTSPVTSTAAAAACCRRAIRTTSIEPAAPLFFRRDLILIVGTPFDFRMGYGRRISTKAQAGADRHGLSHVGKNRDIDLGLVGEPGRHSGGGVAGGLRPSQAGQAPGAPAMDEKADRRRSGGYREADALFQSNNTPIHPYRVAYELNEFLAETPSTSATAATS